MAVSFTLASSERVRYATGSIMYFAQGIPQGLLAIAIPVWLASQGVGAGDIGAYAAGLPDLLRDRPNLKVHS